MKLILIATDSDYEPTFPVTGNHVCASMDIEPSLFDPQHRARAREVLMPAFARVGEEYRKLV